MKDEPIGRKINILARVFNDSVREKVNETGISSSCFHLLGIILKSEMDNKKMTQKDICNITLLKAPTVSIMLNDMEKEGYIEKEKSLEDGRITYLHLTEKGHHKCDEIKDLFTSVDRQLEESLSEKELKQFNYLMDKMIDNMKGDMKNV